MTVEDLIKKLQSLPKDAVVSVDLGRGLWAEVDNLALELGVNADGMVVKIAEISHDDEPTYAVNMRKFDDI